MTFSKKILLWYSQNKRPLPWRETMDPYYIWLSEIMLQQTRVAQGIPFYQKFLKNFPTVFHLANATEEEVLKLWQGLGYYSRARNLHTTAKKIANDYQGKFPDTYEDLMKLKGVGDYTASAIASISFDRAEPVVDGNVYRVLARYFGVDYPINSSRGTTYFKNLAREVMDTESVRNYNQGIMEFGAIQCTPQAPDCKQCPLNDSCLALAQNRIRELPVKNTKKKLKIRYFNYLIVIDESGMTYLRKRIGKGIWQNLYEIPLLETEEEINLNRLNKRIPEIIQLNAITGVHLMNTKTIIHKLSHQHLHVKFWKVKTKDQIVNGMALWELENYPVPVLIADFIKKLNQETALNDFKQA